VAIADKRERKVGMATSDGEALHSCDLLCPVAHLMRSVPPFVDPESTLRAAAQVMAEQRIGAVILLGPDGPSRIVTEHDVVNALAEQADPDTVWVADVASTDLTALDPDATVIEAMRLMGSKQIHHVPVKSNGTVVGMVVAEDVLELMGSRQR
jgi:CBS domain-containing protein